MITFHVTCCDKLFFCIYEGPNYAKTAAEPLLIYPNAPIAVIPESIRTFSPRFAELFNQAAFAEQHNCFELAGTGYRNAIEIIVKDFAIKKLKEPEKEVCRCSLDEAITQYLPSVKTKIAADVIKNLGNDYTHYKNKHGDIPFENLKMYMNIFIKQIDAELLTIDPIIPSKHLPAGQIQS